MSGVLTHTAQKRLFHEVEVDEVCGEWSETACTDERCKTNLYLLAVKLGFEPFDEVANADVGILTHLLLDFEIKFAVVRNDLILGIQFIRHHRTD